MNKISQAILFATEAFDGRVRKFDGSPAILHSLEAAAITQTVCGDEDVVCAAVLHDTVEDAGATLLQIEERFGERVALLVRSETENKRPGEPPERTWLARKQETLELLVRSEDPGVKALWLGDKLSNMRSLYRMKRSLGDGMWALFHQKCPQQHEKYYRAIAAALEEYADTVAYREYRALMEKVFGGNEDVEGHQ